VSETHPAPEPQDDEAPDPSNPEFWLWATPKGRRRPKPEDLIYVLRGMAGGTSLLKMCQALGLDEPSTYHALCSPAWRHNYVIARDIRTLRLGEKALDLGLATADPKSKIKPDAARVAIDTIKWFNGKVSPKLFGDKIAHVGGGEGDAPIRHEHDLSKLSEADLAALESAGRALGLSGPAVPDRGREGEAEG
jgi:hypothetical protein